MCICPESVQLVLQEAVPLVKKAAISVSGAWKCAWWSACRAASADVCSCSGKREAAQFLQSLGLQGKAVQRIVARHGNGTKEAVTKDPYHAMRGIKGMNLRWAAARDLERHATQGQSVCPEADG